MSKQAEHWRQYFDREHLGAWDLVDKDWTVTIESVTQGEVYNREKNERSRKAFISFKGAEKKFVANVTNCTIIAGMYGNAPANWVGKKITLYATQTSVGGAMKECIRVRPGVPK